MTIYRLDLAHAQHRNRADYHPGPGTAYEPDPAVGDDSLLDGDDATYVIGSRGSTIAATEGAAMGMPPIYTGPTAGVERIELFFRASVQTSDVNPTLFVVEQYRMTPVGGIGLGWTEVSPQVPLSIPSDGAIYDFSVLADDRILSATGWANLDELADDWATYQSFVLFDLYDDTGTPLQVLRIHEAWIEVEVSGGFPRRRKGPGYPLTRHGNDGTRAGSTRRGPAATY